MDVKMVDRLTAILSIVDHKSVTILETLLFGNLGSNDHEVAEHLLVTIFSMDELTETISVLWNDQEVSLGNWSNISEGDALIVIIDLVAWDITGNDLVEEGDFLGLSCLSLSLFV